MKRCVLTGLLAFCTLALHLNESTPQQPPSPDPARLRVPPGFTVEVIAAPPLVHHPMMANFDERGRLYVAESSGLNLKAADLLKELPNKVLLLDDIDAKGRFTRSRVFADKMTFPSGALPYKGSVYVTAAPHIWKLTQRAALTPNPSPKGRGEKEGGPSPKGRGEIVVDRTELVSKFNFIGNAADVHGPFLGPDGRIYWCDGRHGHEIKRPDGSISKGKAARIFRCKPDGSEVEVVCGGGMDNPVEIAFTEEGEPFVTVDILHNQPSRNDGIIFAIEGGNYPWHEASKEFPRTGELLPAIENLGWVAPSGLMRYRSSTFGKEYQGNLFSAQFNRHRIQRHILERDGAGFKCKTEDFLTSEDKNFHPTDVFEDADGSLIVIDTGGWFRIGCPTSQIARPEFKGAIYRIRKLPSPPGRGVEGGSAKSPMALPSPPAPLPGGEGSKDPRGLALAWPSLSPDDLARLLDDSRFAVRDRAIEELANRGKDALPALAKALSAKSPRVRLNAVWAATRIDHADARRLVMPRIGDEDRSVRLAAIHSAGLHRDATAFPRLCVAVVTDDPATRRQAATALGRIRNPNAVDALLGAVNRGGDRFLEHALIYALIQIDDRKKTAAYLENINPQVRRAALIALDQMPNGNLTREELARQLGSNHPPLVKGVLDIVASRPKWAGEITPLLSDWLANPRPESLTPQNVQALLLALAKESAVQDLIAQALGNPKTPRSHRLMLVETLGRANVAKLPPAWLAELGKTLDAADGAFVRQGIAVLRARNLGQFDVKLDRLVHDVKQPAETRVQAFGAMAARTSKVDDASFAFLFGQLRSDVPPLIRLATAKGLSQAKLTDGQLLQLTKAIAAAGPLEMPVLLSAFEKNTSADIGRALLASLEKCRSFASLTPASLEKAVQQCPEPIRRQAVKLAERLQVGSAKQKARIDELMPLTSGGSVEQGRDIFFGNKALCSACHAINNKGGGVGPDLGKIGAIRSGRDLLESIVFPSASFARGFEPYVVETKSGKTVTGILARESLDAVHLLTTERVEVRINREEIETFAPGRVSIMPQGLDGQLSSRELRDLLAYLQGLR